VGSATKDFENGSGTILINSFVIHWRIAVVQQTSSTSDVENPLVEPVCGVNGQPVQSSRYRSPEVVDLGKASKWLQGGYLAACMDNFYQGKQ
jgi:hypothetical protein